ncbi:helix-turn-helix domain-containing protein [Chryseobacterium oryctis]|uniref:AraC family transcriptional regulator n=1 Tax=Chryseobacterium oryctis TaxID=2952618 RepID=A0ABT3HQ91_9FLAO|nr:AraC family transcriptional regulator [Chryseobacterium oryctis]MCW3161909.1 AraC family transcriptional regulator [Chryseobacterium oryctis]
MREELIIFTLVDLIINIIIAIFIYNIKYSIIRLFITPYMIASSIFIYCILILFWNHSPLSLIWYLVFPIAAHHFFTIRSAVYWSIYITFLVLITFFANQWFEVPRLEISQNNLFIINIFTLLSVIYLISFFLYYKHQITLTDLKDNFKGISDINENNTSISNSDTSNLYPTYNKIYNEIIFLFENDNIYLNSNFTISKLAEALDTNVSYVSRTLNLIAGSNFNTFLNKYRIEYIKKLMQNDDYDRYKLTYLYTQAGYKNQSTFNKVFKDFEGVTPTEYIQNLKENIQPETKKPQK